MNKIEAKKLDPRAEKAIALARMVDELAGEANRLAMEQPAPPAKLLCEILRGLEGAERRLWQVARWMDRRRPA